MEAIKIADEIEKKIKFSESMRLEIKSRAMRKRTAITEYDKKLGITIIKLKNLKKGEIMMLENEIITPPIRTTICEKIAKAICWKEKLELEEANAMYRCLISNLKSIDAEMKGYQSINRHLD